MIIDNQIEGLTCDITSNFLDIYLNENNNSFSNTDNRTVSNAVSTVTTTAIFNLPESTFSFKSNFMLSVNFKLNKTDENDDLKMDSTDNKLTKQLAKQSVKRALFVEKDEIDHEANLKLVRKQMEQLEKQDCEKWNFDFKNNRPLNSLDSRYEWSFTEPVLNKLDLNTKSSSLNKPSSINVSIPNNSNKINNISHCDKKSDEPSQCNTSSTANHINTRSLKRKLNISDYFQPAKKRTQNYISKDQPSKSSDVLLPVNKSNVKYTAELKETGKSIKFNQPIKPSLKRKCKKSRSSTQTRRQKKSKSLEKVTTKRQTTLKF